MFLSSWREEFTLICSKTQWQMFLLVSGRHVGAHPVAGKQHCVFIQISINFGKEFLRMSCLWKIAVTWNLVRIFVYLHSPISQILDFVYWTVLIFVLIDFGWLVTENQLLKYYIFFSKFSDHDFAGSSIHPTISAPSAISSSLPASQTTSLNVLPATSKQKISATRAINTPSINSSRATELHSSFLESSISRGKDWIVL